MNDMLVNTDDDCYGPLRINFRVLWRPYQDFLSAYLCYYDRHLAKCKNKQELNERCIELGTLTRVSPLC